MRGLVAAVLALALVWCAYWFVGARFVGTQAEHVFAQARASGLLATRDDLRVRGFPNRFDLTIDGLHLSDPATGTGWDAPFVQIFALTYRPWQLIVAFPPEQRFRTSVGPLTLSAVKLQASLRLRPRIALPLDQTRLVGTDLGLTSASGWTAVADELRLATRELDGSGRNHKIGLEVHNLGPDRSRLPGAGDLPEQIDRLRLDADLGFDAPLDRFAAGAYPALTGIRLHEALLVWGDVSAHASGQIAPDAAGLAEGSLDLRLTKWRKLLPVAVAAGILKPGVAQTWERVLEVLAQPSGDPDTIDVVLTFERGRIRIGRLPLGPAPRLR